MNSSVCSLAIACIFMLGMSYAEEGDNAGLNPDNCKLAPEMIAIRAKCAEELMGKAVLTQEEWVTLYHEKEKELEDCFHKHTGKAPTDKMTEEDADRISKVITFANDGLAQEALEGMKECIKEEQAKKETWECILEKLTEVCQ